MGWVVTDMEAVCVESIKGDSGLDPSPGPDLIKVRRWKGPVLGSRCGSIISKKLKS